MLRLVAAGAIALALTGACSTAPPPTAAALRLARNSRATVEGRVTDSDGRPVAGVRVQAVPGGRDIIWSAPQPTDEEGRFRLSLDAPAEYVFLIFEGSVAVLTPLPQDPGQVRVFVQPAETMRGVELKFLQRERGLLIEPLAPLREGGTARPAGEGAQELGRGMP